MEKRTGIWLPVELIKNKELDWTNKVLLAEIHSLHELPKGCIASNEYFGELLGITKASASKRITQLTKLGYIETKNIYEKGMCVGRLIIPTEKRNNTDKSEKVQEVKNGSSQENHEVVPGRLGGSSQENHGVVPERPGSSSLTISGVVPGRPGGSSQTTRGVVPERLGGSSRENTTNTSTNKEKEEEKEKQLPAQEEILKQVPVQYTGENSELSISNNNQNGEISELKKMRVAMNEWFDDYPNWESDLMRLGVDSFIWKTAKKYGTDKPLSIDIIKYFLTL